MMVWGLAWTSCPTRSYLELLHHAVHALQVAAGSGMTPTVTVILAHAWRVPPVAEYGYGYGSLVNTLVILALLAGFHQSGTALGQGLDDALSVTWRLSYALGCVPLAASSTVLVYRLSFLKESRVWQGRASARRCASSVRGCARMRDPRAALQHVQMLIFICLQAVFVYKAQASAHPDVD